MNLATWGISLPTFPLGTGYGMLSAWSARFEIRRRKRAEQGRLLSRGISPKEVADAQAAFYAEKESLPLADTVGRICSEFVMCYPPGIPIRAGRTDYGGNPFHTSVTRRKGCSMTGPEDPEIRRLNVLKEWNREMDTMVSERHTPCETLSDRPALYSAHSDFQRIDVFESKRNSVGF